MDEGDEYDVEFVESGEDAPESLQSAEQSFNFIAFAIHNTVVLLGRDPSADK